MAIYTKSGGEIKSVTPYLKRNGEVITPSSVWVKTGGEVHKVWPVEDGPFEIYDQATLEEFRDRVNAGEYGLDAVVTADFTVTGDFGDPIAATTSLSSTATFYRGTFDGKGHTITGLTIDSSLPYVGLFSASFGNISDVHLVGMNINCSESTGYVGGILGEMLSGGELSKCTTEGDVSGYGAGGIVGYVGYSKVTDCAHIGGVVTSGASNAFAGGIAGKCNTSSTITGCTNAGSVTASSSYSSAGGIVGDGFAYSVIERCVNSGAISGNVAGGIVGDCSQTTVTGCTNSGAVTSSGSSNRAGGIVGKNSKGTVTDCINTGTVTGSTITELSATEDESTSAAGGIVGYNTIGSTVEGNTNEGEVTGAAHTGDIIGMEGPAKEEDVPEEAASTEEE